MSGLSRVFRTQREARRDEWSQWRQLDETDDEVDNWSVTSDEQAACASLHGMIEKIRRFFHHVTRRDDEMNGVEELADGFSAIRTSGEDGLNAVRFIEEESGGRLRRVHGY